jgi:hypothetical protein
MSEGRRGIAAIQEHRLAGEGPVRVGALRYHAAFTLHLE